MRGDRASRAASRAVCHAAAVAGTRKLAPRKGPDVVIAIFFVAHWQLSVFFQTFFLHRYGAHRMFTMSKGWERFFYLCTYVAQGSSFLSPRGYAILHRMHHAYSDTPQDPHSPTNYKDVATM